MASEYSATYRKGLLAPFLTTTLVGQVSYEFYLSLFLQIYVPWRQGGPVIPSGIESPF